MNFASCSAFVKRVKASTTTTGSITTIIHSVVYYLDTNVSDTTNVVVKGRLNTKGLGHKGTCNVEVTGLSFLYKTIVAILVTISTPIVLRFMGLAPRTTRCLGRLFNMLTFCVVKQSMGRVVVGNIFNSKKSAVFSVCSLTIAV